MPIYNDQFTVVNPKGYLPGIIAVINETRDINVLKMALTNPICNDEMINAVNLRLEFLSVQGCVTPSLKADFYLSMVNKTSDVAFLSSVLNSSCLTNEVLDAIDSRLESMSFQGCVTPSALTDFSVAIEAKRAELSRGR